MLLSYFNPLPPPPPPPLPLSLFVAGALYNVALSASSGASRARLETLGELYFNSQNVATQAAFNFSAWFIYVVGRLAINFVLDGPDRTAQGIASMTPVDVLEFLFAPRGAA